MECFRYRDLLLHGHYHARLCAGCQYRCRGPARSIPRWNDLLLLDYLDQSRNNTLSCSISIRILACQESPRSSPLPSLHRPYVTLGMSVSLRCLVSLTDRGRRSTFAIDIVTLDERCPKEQLTVRSLRTLSLLLQRNISALSRAQMTMSRHTTLTNVYESSYPHLTIHWAIGTRIC